MKRACLRDFFGLAAGFGTGVEEPVSALACHVAAKADDSGGTVRSCAANKSRPASKDAPLWQVLASVAALVSFGTKDCVTCVYAHKQRVEYLANLRATNCQCLVHSCRIAGVLKRSCPANRAC